MTCRESFEKEYGASRFLYRLGGGPNNEFVPNGDYVDPGIQRAWELWQKAWNAALSTQPPQD